MLSTCANVVKEFEYVTINTTHIKAVVWVHIHVDIYIPLMVLEWANVCGDEMIKALDNKREERLFSEDNAPDCVH